MEELHLFLLLNYVAWVEVARAKEMHVQREDSIDSFGRVRSRARAV